MTPNPLFDLAAYLDSLRPIVFIPAVLLAIAILKAIALRRLS
jgi:hypothetical protein